MLPTAHPASSRDCRWRVSWSSYYMRLGRRHESMCVDVVFPKDDLAMFAYPGLHGRKAMPTKLMPGLSPRTVNRAIITIIPPTLAAAVQPTYISHPGNGDIVVPVGVATTSYGQ